MAACSACGATILFGGVKTKNLRFCNKKCHQNGTVLLVADQVPNDLCHEYAHELRQENCPKCRGAGPVDIHSSHYVWSLGYFTKYFSKPELCCRSCGVKGKIKGILFFLFLGWWGILGLVFTPVMIGRNLFEMFRDGNSGRPSAALEQTARLHLSNQFTL